MIAEAAEKGAKQVLLYTCQMYMPTYINIHSLKAHTHPT